ncbi:MAG TPA: cytochrome c-type biogenesis protein [Acidisphaera sp.]|nr:cytochrome c-type biogenesis protein [Acidisphaera sp.]
MLALLCALALPAHAISSPDEVMASPAQEARAEAIGRQLRCLVCQNESIEESDADLARDLRHDIRVRVAQGETNQQIIAWMVARYGDFVRLRPPFEPITLLLWASPLLAVGAGAAAVVLARRRRPAPPAPLSGDERARLARLLEP